MKKLLFSLSIVVLLASGCNSNQQTAQQQNSQPQPTPVQQPQQPATPALKVWIVYPPGISKFEVNSTVGVPIAYSISSNLANQLTASDTTELYLLDKNGVVVGFIGAVDPKQQTYSWEPTRLAHWSAVGIITKAPSAGDYQLLLVSRKNALLTNLPGYHVIGIFVDGITKYDGTKLIVMDNNQPTYPDVLGLAVSSIVTLQVNDNNSQSDWKNTVYNEFKDLAVWQQSDIPNWQFSPDPHELEHEAKLKIYGSGKILMMSKSFNQNGCQSDCSVEDNAQNNLLASVKTALSQNGWNAVSWPSEPYFYTDYLYVKGGHPLIVQTGTRDAITGGLYVDVEFQY